MTTTYNLFGLGQQSKSSNFTAAHRLNCYYDLQKVSDKANIVAYGTPGLTEFCQISEQKIAGMHYLEKNDRLYVVQGRFIYRVRQDGTFGLRGTLNQVPGAYVGMANNGSQIAIFDGVYAYIFDTGPGTLTDITASLPWVTTPGTDLAGDSVTFLDGRFIARRPNTGQFYISELYDGLTWGALDYATAEQSPDGLIAVMADKGNLALIGNYSIELWSNVGDPVFPYQRINASPTDGGLAARWSLQKCKSSLTGLFRNRAGALSVCILDGYQLLPISDFDMDYIINGYGTTGDAVGYSYVMNGRQFYQISFPTEEKTWLYDFETQCWSQLKSQYSNRHYGDIGTAYAGYHFISDYRNGKIYYLDVNNYTDNGDTIEREIVGTHLTVPSGNYSTIRRLRVDCETGTGTATLNPQLMLSISRDYGHTFGQGLWVNMGKVGEYMKRCEWRRLGRARDWVFKLRMTDNAKFAIIGAVVEAMELNK
jgi:hypothetical protein